MKRVPQGRYTKEFKEEAVKLVLEEKQSLPEVARRLSQASSTLRYWGKAYREGKLSHPFAAAVNTGEGLRWCFNRQIPPERPLNHI